MENIIKDQNKIELINIRKCCQCSETALKNFIDSEKLEGREYKVIIKGMFQAKDDGLDVLLGFKLDSLNDFGYIWIPTTGFFKQIPVIKAWY